MNAYTPSSEVPSAQSDRRDFLTILAGVAALGVVPFAASLVSRRRETYAAVSPNAAIPELAAFVPHIGSSFVAAATESQTSFRITLSEAEALKKHHPGAGEPFSLRFSASDGHVIESRIYQLRHPVLGDLELFLSPVGSAEKFGEKQKGEAVINPFVRLS